MARSQKRKKLSSRKKFQKRNYRLRLCSRKRNFKNKRQIVSRRKAKRYQRGGESTGSSGRSTPVSRPSRLSSLSSGLGDVAERGAAVLLVGAIEQQVL